MFFATNEDMIRESGNLLAHANRVLFITGAGISADSGLPTYRGIGGLYEDKLTTHDIPIEEALSGDMLRKDPALTWHYLKQIEEACRGAKHNEAHRIIADLEAHKTGVWVLTQNIDGFHRDAGSNNLIEIHGRIHDLYCMHCDYQTEVADYTQLDDCPKCPVCGSTVRPDVVLFGEMLPESGINRIHSEFEHGFDIIFSVGTSSAFPYISGPVVHGKQRGIPTVEINPGQTPISRYVDFKIPMTAKEALTKIHDQMVARMGF